MKRQRGRRRTKRVREDPQLQLIGELLSGGFLHYGYFDDPDRQPEDVSLNDIVGAQLRYAELLANQIEDRSAPVLDVGAGMGGLIPVLQRRGFTPVALTPDRIQIEYIRRTYPEVLAIHAKFEELADPAHGDHTGRYGTVVTSESLQYLKLDQALPMVAAILKSGGRWIVCDYFRTRAATAGGATPTNVRVNRAGHDWDDFRATIERAGWHAVHERDITINVLPTLRCLYMFGRRFGLPVLHFAIDKLRCKQPGIHYIFEDLLEQFAAVLAGNLEIVNPETFAAQKKYVLMVMERTRDEKSTKARVSKGGAVTVAVPTA